jgi:hypothetical protein
MRLRMVDYCNAEVILNGNLRLKQEIVEILQTVHIDPLAPGPSPHRYLQEAFKKCGWTSEALVSRSTLRRHYFDLFKDRVAIEIEFSNRENLYRDYFRFMLAEHEGMIDVGVIITWDPRIEAHIVEISQGGIADLQQARDDLGWIRLWFRMPIWVIGLS